MKNFKFSFPVLALAVALILSAFTLPGKVAKPTSQLYWYRVTYDGSHPLGAVLSSSDFIIQDDKANVSNPCTPGSNADCLRGFSSQIAPANFPEEDAGADQIMKQ